MITLRPIVRSAALSCAILLLACSGSPTGLIPPDAGTPADASAERDFDLGADFSFTHNPNGAWHYGYTAGTTLAAHEIMLDMVTVEAGSVTFWHPAAGSGGYYPYIAKSSSDAAATDATQSWHVGPGQVALEASGTGQYSIVAFVAPRSGRYHVEARFEGIHIRLSTTDVHVRRNDEELFAAEIDGFGGDPAFFPVQGANPSASYEGTLGLQADDTVSFAVGYGANQGNGNDTTGLVAHIRQLD